MKNQKNQKQYVYLLYQNGYWLNSMKAYDFDHVDKSEFKNEEKIINSLTKEDIMAVAKKYLKTDNYVRVFINPKK